MVTNRRKIDNDGQEFFPTPEWCTKSLLNYERFSGKVVDGCCGDGAMAKVISDYGYTVIASDLYDRGYGEQRDIFDYEYPIDNFVTNPPYNIASEILEHALKITENKVCLLLRTAFLESVGRYNKFFKEHPPTRVYVFSERITMYPNGVKTKGSGTTCYSWFVWDKNDTSHKSTLLWIEPGFKEK